MQNSVMLETWTGQLLWQEKKKRRKDKMQEAGDADKDGSKVAAAAAWSPCLNSSKV